MIPVAHPLTVAGVERCGDLVRQRGRLEQGMIEQGIHHNIVEPVQARVISGDFFVLFHQLCHRSGRQLAVNKIRLGKLIAHCLQLLCRQNRRDAQQHYSAGKRVVA